jgi:23S rRNA pseudouridine2605 synthase
MNLVIVNTSFHRHGLARVLSKLGYCSRAEAQRLIRAGKVALNGRVCLDPEHPTLQGRDVICIEGQQTVVQSLVYLMLNKPRGWVTTASDERGRTTVFAGLSGEPWIPEAGDGMASDSTEGAIDVASGVSERSWGHLSAVGRLDQASEGLLLFTNDTGWAARLTDPQQAVEKVYHVQVDRLADEEWLARLVAGVRGPDGEVLRASKVSLLRAGPKRCWLEVVLHEGRNRHIRRLLQAVGAEVDRLVRVRVGALELGRLPKGRYRKLTDREVQDLGRA